MRASLLLNIVATLTAVAIGFFLGLAAANETHLSKWIYDFQTLVAGMLAVIAAAGTITQMRWSDERQHERHQDVLNLTLRADRLRLKRAAEPFAKLLIATANATEKFLSREWNRPSDSERQSALDKINRLKRLAEHKDIAAVVDLFDPAAAIAYEGILKACATLDGMLNEYLTEARNGVASIKAQAYFNSVVRYARLLPPLAKILGAELNRINEAHKENKLL